MIRRIRFDQPDAAVPDGRWTFAGRPEGPHVMCRHATGPAELRDGSLLLRRWDDPCDALRWIESDARNADASIRWAGFVGYELGGRFETLPPPAVDPVGLPVLCFGRFRRVAATADRARPRLPTLGATAVHSTFSREDYLRAVRRCLEYISAGDVFQINLSQRFSAHTALSAADIYANLLDSTPAHYGALIECDGLDVVCNSPELFLRVGHDRRIQTRPIKGTRPRGAASQADLMRSEKDAAELNMIIDLERNDLGRICEIGSVRVTQPRTIETHPTLLHGVATIEGKLKSGLALPDLLAATFPGGSITGAPKIRAMQIIRELEPVSRGIYCGAIGYVDPDGSIEFNIAIRTMTLKQQTAHIPVGGGIVADSVPELEFDETIVKSRAMFSALGLIPPSMIELESDLDRGA